MRFLVDMPLSPNLAAWLKNQGHDAIHAQEVGLAGADDQTILAQALKDERVVITADLDYPRLLAAAGRDGPGIVLIRGGNFNERESVELLARVLRSVPPEELPHSIVVAEQHRVRRRRLPLAFES